MRRQEIDELLVTSPTYRNATFAFHLRGVHDPSLAESWHWFWRGWYKFPSHRALCRERVVRKKVSG